MEKKFKLRCKNPTIINCFSQQIAIDKLKETVKTDDTAAIKADTEALEKAFYAVSEKLYQQQGAAGADAGNAGNAGGDGTYYDANYEDNSNNSGN